MDIDIFAPGDIGDVEVCWGKRLQLVEIVPADIDLELAVFDLQFGNRPLPGPSTFPRWWPSAPRSFRLPRFLPAPSRGLVQGP
jgi:hypothetical protein